MTRRRSTRSTCSISPTVRSTWPTAPVGPRSCPARGRVLALGRFRESRAGEITPRQVLILVEWESRAAFESYRQDPALADLHPHRERGASAYVWHLFDRLDDLRPLLRP